MTDDFPRFHQQGFNRVVSNLQIPRQPHVGYEQAVSEHPDRGVVFVVVALSFLDAEERLAPVLCRMRLQSRLDAHRHAFEEQSVFLQLGERQDGGDRRGCVEEQQARRAFHRDPVAADPERSELGLARQDYLLLRPHQLDDQIARAAHGAHSLDFGPGEIRGDFHLAGSRRDDQRFFGPRSGLQYPARGE